MHNVYRLVLALGLGGVVKQASDSREKSWIRELLAFPFLGLQDIDWDRTKAYSAIHFGPIFLDCDTEEEREQLKQEIATELKMLEHSGETVVEDLFFREEVFHGDKVEEAPDIIYRTTDMKYQMHRYFEFGSNEVVTPRHNTGTGHHRMEGIFLATGPTIGEGRLSQADIIDVAPTILQLLDYPVPEDMDGRVMDEILA